MAGTALGAHFQVKSVAFVVERDGGKLNYRKRERQTRVEDVQRASFLFHDNSSLIVLPSQQLAHSLNEISYLLTLCTLFVRRQDKNALLSWEASGTRG